MKTLSASGIVNPFVTSGYVSAAYFCDREVESEQLVRYLVNGNNVALLSMRRMGKTGLIHHCFSNEVFSDFHVFFVDIYATKSLRDFIYLLSKAIVDRLKTRGKKAVELFVNSVRSLQTCMTYDSEGNLSLNLQLGDIRNSEATLDEIFKYLSAADKHCIVAIDEFQQIATYPEKNVEALLRTYVQQCSNAHFVFAGSRRHVMSNMFLSASRPFYQSVSMINLEAINEDRYVAFACGHFADNGRVVTEEAVRYIYHRFGGVTWYVQKVLNVLYSVTERGGMSDVDRLEGVIESVVDSYSYTYKEILFRLPEKQKELLLVIAKEGNAKNLTSETFIRNNRLSSASSVQSALKVLLEKDFVTQVDGCYQLYDKFFELWLKGE